MTSYELGKLIKDRLGAVGLAQYLDEAREQYLEFPDGFFAEVVLTDGSKLPEAQMLVKSIEEELRKQGIELDAIVRATWEVVRVEKAGMAPPLRDALRQQGAAGTLPLSAGVQRLIATLRSGERECRVEVNVTAGALGMVLAAFNQGALREYGVNHDEVLKSIVAEFVRLELSYGGESYWDPILYPELTLNENALEYLTAHRPAKAGKH
jgi:hypothetical protein